jgi:tellurite resistance protein
MQNHEIEIEFINAASAVYAWMCVSDGNITAEESQGFSEYLSALPYVNNTSHQDFVTAYSAILKAFQEDFDLAYEQTLERVKPLRLNKQSAMDLIQIARKAMVIDEKLEEVEENVLRELCTILDINESELP